MPAAIAAPAVRYTPQDFDKDVQKYRQDLGNGKLADAKNDRNQIIYRVLAQIDVAYGAFELNLSTRRAGAQTAADATQLGLTAAATVSGTSEVKDILTATATAFQGTRLSFDKNFFEQKTTEALVAQMRASRRTLKAQMIRSLSRRDVASYPLEAAQTDLMSYYYAGTIPSALVDIAAKAGSDAEKATDELKKAVKELTPATPEEEHEAITIRTEFGRLDAAVNSGSRDAAQRAGVTIRSILGAAGVSCPENADPKALLGALKKAMADAEDDHELLNRLNAAVQAAAESKE